jgi:hypothetical protein
MRWSGFRFSSSALTPDWASIFMVTNNKDQHWVPQSYLQAWTDPNRPAHYEPFVHLFNRQGGEHRCRSPANIFSMPELYTIFVGAERDLSIERLFGDLEDNFVRVRNLIASKSDLESTDVEFLYAFVAAMLARPPHKIDHIKNQWASIVAKARTIRINPKVPPIPTLGRSGPALTLNEAQRMADDPMGTWFPHSLRTHLHALEQRFGCDVLINGSPHPFLASDNPAVTYFPPRSDGRRLPPRGLSSPGCEITMPVSPAYALRFTHKAPGIHDCIVLDWEGVFDVNFRTVTRAHMTIVSDRPDLFFVKTILDRVTEVSSVRS